MTPAWTVTTRSARWPTRSGIEEASTGQATGIEQVNKALSQMDEVTQQNSALVEENAATAKTLEQQVKAMDERLGVFRLSTDAAAASQRRARALPVAAVRSAACKVRSLRACNLTTGKSFRQRHQSAAV
jgi:hypothetical protein